MIDQDPVIAKIEEPLFRGREYLSKIVDYLLTGFFPGELKKGQKYHFIKKSKQYVMIEDELYMQGADRALRRVPWREEIYHVLSANHEGAYGGHYHYKGSSSYTRSWPHKMTCEKKCRARVTARV